jgi:hypothetical protein
MNALQLQKREKLRTHERNAAEVIGPKDFRYYVYLIDGMVNRVGPATGVRLTNTEVLFVLGQLVVTRLPRQEMYFAARQPIAPPVLF